MVPLISILLYVFMTKSFTTNSYKSVERVHWNIREFNATEVMLNQLRLLREECLKNNEPFYHDLYPLLFPRPNRIVEQIPASYKFNEDYLTKYSKPFTRVYKHDHKVFVYFDDSLPLMDRVLQYEKEKHDHDTHRLFSVNEEMDTKEFFEKLRRENARNDENGPFYYFSQNLKQLGSKIFHDVEAYTSNLMVTTRDKRINIWIGGRGSTAQGHYDATHNMYIQLKGMKRFKLYEPAAWRYMYLYPALHPFHRQSQVDFYNPDLKRFPEMWKLTSPEHNFKGPYEVTLLPGDLLYVLISSIVLIIFD